MAAAVQALCALWWSSGPPRPCRVPGQAGVKVRAYVDTRRELDGTACV
ncbi:DUF6207 family protein [Streptomyces sp. NPDC039022]